LRSHYFHFQEYWFLILTSDRIIIAAIACKLKYVYSLQKQSPKALELNDLKPKPNITLPNFQVKIALIEL